MVMKVITVILIVQSVISSMGRFVRKFLDGVPSVLTMLRGSSSVESVLFQ